MNAFGVAIMEVSELAEEIATRREWLTILPNRTWVSASGCSRHDVKRLTRDACGRCAQFNI